MPSCTAAAAFRRPRDKSMRLNVATMARVCAFVQALREQDLTAIADAGDPIRYSPGELVALAHPGAAATAFFLVTAGEVMLLPASLQIPPGTTQLDVAKVGPAVWSLGFRERQGC